MFFPLDAISQVLCTALVMMTNLYFISMLTETHPVVNIRQENIIHSGQKMIEIDITFTEHCPLSFPSHASHLDSFDPLPSLSHSADLEA